MKKILLPKTLYFSPKAKETIACTGIDPECQPVYGMVKKTGLYSVKVIITTEDVAPEEETHILSGDDDTGYSFYPQFLRDRQSFSQEWFGEGMD